MAKHPPAFIVGGEPATDHAGLGHPISKLEGNECAILGLFWDAQYLF